MLIRDFLFKSQDVFNQFGLHVWILLTSVSGYYFNFIFLFDHFFFLSNF